MPRGRRGLLQRAERLARQAADLEEEAKNDAAKRAGDGDEGDARKKPRGEGSGGATASMETDGMDVDVALN